MKILIVSSLGYIGGGAESLISLIKPELEAMGHEVRIFTSDEHPKVPHFSDYEFESFTTHSFVAQMFEKLFYTKAYVALRKVLKTYQPDIVHVHTTELLSSSVFFAVKGYPAAVTVHGPEEYLPSLMLWTIPSELFKGEEVTVQNLTLLGRIHYLYYQILSKNIFRIGMRNINMMVVPSLYMGKAVAREGHKGHLLYDATKLFAYSPINPSSKIIAYVGRLEIGKGVQHAINALPTILKAHPDVQLIIAGTGSYKGELEKLVNRLGLEKNVSFKGIINREAVYELYKESFVSIVPSEWPEPFGLVGIEAMSAGRPVVGSNVGGIPEWLEDGVSGIVVEPRDSEAIATAIVQLMDNVDELRAMSIAARKKAETFSIQEHTAALARLYGDVIQNTKK